MTWEEYVAYISDGPLPTLIRAVEKVPMHHWATCPMYQYVPEPEATCTCWVGPLRAALEAAKAAL